MVTDLSSRLQAFFWGATLGLRRRWREIKQGLALARHRRRRGLPRVVVKEAPAPRLTDPAITAYGLEPRHHPWLQLQTETSWTEAGDDQTSFQLIAQGELELLPRVTLEALLLVASAENLAMVTWRTPGGKVSLLRQPVSERRKEGAVLGKVLGRDRLPTDYLLAPGHVDPVIFGTFCRLDVALADLPAADDRRTVLFLLPFLAVGGAERLLIELVSAWSKRYRMLIVTTEPHRPELGSTVDAVGTFTPWVLTLGDWLPRDALLNALSHLIRRYRVETFFSWNGTVFFYDEIARLKEHFPALRVAAQLFDHRGGFLTRTTPQARRAIGVHVAVNEAIGVALHALGATPESVHVVPHGVALPAPLSAVEHEQRRKARRGELGLPETAIVVGSFIRLHEQKRPFDLVDLARRFAERHPQFFFLIVGGGPLEADLRRELAERPVPNLRLEEMRADILPLYDALDLCLMSSAFEGLPIFLLDGLARGLPGVATDVGAIAELFATGGGITVAVGDLDGMEGALLTFADADSRRQAGRAGARRVAEKFSLETCLERYEKLVFP